MADWKLAVKGQQPHKIQPLRVKMLKVREVRANNDYTLQVELSDGRSGIFDVKPYLEKGVFKQLKDKDYFKQVKPLFSGIVWPDEQDLSADTIAYELKPSKIKSWNREAPHNAPRPGHRSHESVSVGSADQAESTLGEQKPE